MNKPKYLIYATLLDVFQDYKSSSELYNQFWGYSEDPEKSEEEFEKEQFQNVIDRINRVPFSSESADKGTAFNEVIDCLILNKKSDKMEIESSSIEQTIRVIFKDNEFIFPISLCKEFSNYYKMAIPQVRTEAILSTQYGDVLLYGVIDELMPLSVHDIKTTNKYFVGKFKNHWQHIVYPYCLNQNGNKVNDFEYNIAVINNKSYSTFTEHYAYVPGRDNKKLLEHLENFIEFLDLNRDLITDKKIFNELK